MATANRGKIADLIEHVSNKGDSYSLVQMLRMLRQYYISHGKYALFDKVSVHPNLSLTNSYGDIRKVRAIQDKESVPSVEIVANFLELYGTTSPLPLFYTQELFREQHQGYEASRTFIDLFNELFYESYFKIWHKFSFLSSLHESADPDFLERLFCLAGLGINTLREQFDNPQQYITFSALASRPVRTAEGLRILLSYIAACSLTVEQCVFRKASIPESQRCSLGKSNTTIGTSVYLGNKISDRMNSIRIQIGPLSSSTLQEFLPDSKKMKLISQTIEFYIDRLLIWDIRIGVESCTLKTTQPGKRNQALLGWNTWLFSGKIDKVVHTTFKPSLHQKRKETAK
jgi:type VI secretion system protein ImpH